MKKTYHKFEGQLVVPPNSDMVLPVRQVFEHSSFFFFELLIQHVSVYDVSCDINTKLGLQFLPKKPSPDSCCFGPVFVTNRDVEPGTFPVTIT